ncbi:PilW family protein [Acetobacterium tundrae]|uniref:Prepilin-type N-terminal cleavage/methylation domain-containing protein n=1 Tax=Acetobacterium tundrae TaxID=132932 RepID=A0ABR6WK94_9FIRM|nr:prepilin-type N-terminal cleavage/methylation domain-containing protein [Acetobacterium tundrae]MBC3796774.1 prepilin-type N-terminal cleavage/methylation domain-containing protein [Acetobacterium tundrae]
MKKIINIRSNKGFTLVELLVALLISGILMATVSSIFLMAQKIYTRGGDISYKQKTITNVETELQNALAVATTVSLSSAATGDFNLGFNDQGQCVEVVDGKTYVIDQISEIFLTGKNQNTLSYQLIPNANMSTLSGGIVMNNKNIIDIDQSSQAKLLSGTKLNVSGDTIHYLVLTVATVPVDPVVPGTNINDTLKATGVIPGRWDLMVDSAAASMEGGYSLSPDGAVYTDSTGTYVTAKNQYIHQDYAATTHPTAAVHYAKYGSVPNEYFLKISSETRVITAADYETDPTLISQTRYWKEGKVPKLGDLYLYNGAYYIWQSNSSYYSCPKDPTNVYNWLKLVSAPSQFQ